MALRASVIGWKANGDKRERLPIPPSPTGKNDSDIIGEKK